MRTRAFVLFWGSTAASVVLLGAIWNLAVRIGGDSFGVEEVVLAAIAGAGFVCTAFIAGRIALIAGRVKRLTLTSKATNPHPHCSPVRARAR